MIVAYPGASGADLARLTFLTPQTINVIVRNLVRAGLVEKTADAAHGRILRLGATARGEALLRRCRARVQEIEGLLTGLVNREEEQVVRRWLANYQQLKEAIEAIRELNHDLLRPERVASKTRRKPHD